MSMVPPDRDGSEEPMDVSPEEDFIYYLRLGHQLMDAGCAEEAKGAAERARELNPNSPRVENLLGLIYFKLGMYDGARAIYEGLIADNADDTPLYVNLGLVLLKQGHLDDAEGRLRQAIERAPEHRRAHTYLGTALYQKGDLEGARDHFLRGETPALASKVQRRIDAAAAEGAEGKEALRNAAAEALQIIAMAQDSMEQAKGAEATDGAPDPITQVGLHVVEDQQPLVTEPQEIETDASMPFDAQALAEPQVVEPVSGFQVVGSKSGVRLELAAPAHVRSSVLICLEGPARVEPVTLYSGASPFVRVEGEGRCEIDVPQQAVVMREAGVMYVRSSCLAGFEGDFRWMQTDLLGTAVLHLEGAGTILMNSVRRGRTIEVRADRPVHVRRDAFLAWTAGVEAERFSGGAEVSDLVVFRGEGRVVIAGLNTEDEGCP